MSMSPKRSSPAEEEGGGLGPVGDCGGSGSRARAERKMAWSFSNWACWAFLARETWRSNCWSLETPWEESSGASGGSSSAGEILNLLPAAVVKREGKGRRREKRMEMKEIVGIERDIFQRERERGFIGV